MTHIKVAWISDSHLGLQQYGLARRRHDFAHAYMSAIKNMIDQGTDLILHTGDLLNSSRPSPEDVAVLKEGNRLLVNHGITMLIVNGNHDSTGLSWADIAKEGETNSGYKMLDTRDGQPFLFGGLKIHGLPHMHRNELVKILPSLKGEVLMLHQAIKDFIGFPSESALSVSEIPLANFQLVAVGDIHINNTYQDIDSKCWIGYSGSTELNSETEPENKVWKELQWENGSLVKISDHPIDTRPVKRITIKTQADLEAALTKLVDDHPHYEANDIRKPIVFCHYTHTVPKILERFIGALDPDDYILRFKPIFSTEAKEGEPASELPDNLTVEDIRRSMVPKDSSLYMISERLMDPNIQSDEANAALDQWIEKQMAEPACELVA